jgi:transcriptional regulator with XRE-family HTH domain
MRRNYVRFNGKAFQTLVRERGLKQKWVARQVGLDGQDVSDFAHGRRAPQLQQVVALAKVLGVEPEVLMVPSDAVL